MKEGPLMATQLDHRTLDGEQIEMFPAPPERPPPGAASQLSRFWGWLVIGIVVALVAGFAVGRAGDSTDLASPTVDVRTQAPLAAPPANDVGAVAAVAEAVSPTVVQLESEDGLGSGVIYSDSGLILTAAHVLQDAANVDVRLADGRLFRGTVIGTHERTDVGVVQIFGASSLPVASLGYGSPVRVGELAVALGSPFGFDQTVTAGIVSAVNRTVNGVPMLQTDAAINPGNSGGPLVDSTGRVIGINDVIFTRGGGNEGIGFAIAIDVAIVVADQLAVGGDVQLAVLGVNTIASMTGAGGAIVQQVFPGSPAEAAGLEIGDRIVAVNGEAVQEPTKLFAAIVTNRPGSVVTVDFVRGDTTRSATVTLAGIEF
ncbi:MAG: S1C family serine protease [Acidimicrobiia bacterium]